MEYKTITVSLKSFLYFGILIFVFSLFLTVNSYISISSSESFVKNNLTGTFIGLIVGIVFVVIGMKKRKIVFEEKNIKYSTSKTIFEANYDEINLIKTFINPANKSENLMIFVDETRLFSFSTSFFPREKLIDAYNELLAKCENYIENNELTIDNELEW
jgi:hypothetical protein